MLPKFLSIGIKKKTQIQKRKPKMHAGVRCAVCEFLLNMCVFFFSLFIHAYFLLWKRSRMDFRCFCTNPAKMDGLCAVLSLLRDLVS